MVLFVTSLILSFFILDIETQIVQQYTQNACASKTTCHECIETPSCAWCYDTAFNTTKRCFQPAYPLSPLDKCDPAKIYNPDNVLTVIQNATVSTRKSVSGGGGIQVEGWEASMNASEHHEMKGSGSHASGGYEGASGIVQVSPQRLSLQLRAKQTYSISMYYTQAEDYPVDLYYLMDLSKSMEDDKQKLSILGNRLANTMKKMTSKFTLGFGSFVDKVVMPYVSTIPENLKHPCPGCEAPYGFKNVMPLSRNTDRFAKMVESANVSGNLDAPEGGFDAIMQAVVCRRQIGWRERARRLLVFSTDAGFHYAGDGKLGGIVKPNDGQCHLDAHGYYSMSDKQDYPSVSQINTFVKKNAINVIFAVTAEKIEIYKKLQKHIEGSSYGQLSKDSSNVVELIKEQYEAISSTVEMKHNASSAVSVKFFSKCLHPDGEITETNKCGGIKVGSLVEFRVELEVIKCPKKRKDWFQTIQIYPVGINESLTIDLEMLCDCPCENLGHPSFRVNANECHNKGTFMCGICDCQDGSYGSYCECLKNETTHILNTNCINPDTGLVCSGRGSCICGKCQCEQRLDPSELIYNDTCECDNFSCERYNGLLCGGEKHGRCDCGECKCIEPWIGSDCSCSNSTAECRRFPNDTELCSGHGTCECGVCICNKTEAGEYSGPFCERVPTFDECDNYKDCVYCEMFRKGMSDKKCETCSISPIGVDVLTVDERNFEKLCAFYDEDQCRYSFIYYTERNGSIGIRAKNELECPPEVFLLGIVLGVIAVVVLVGLAILLLWKLVTTLQDRKEFARFEKEAMMARWDTGENPIYKQATSTFKNPTYAGKG